MGFEDEAGPDAGLPRAAHRRGIADITVDPTVQVRVEADDRTITEYYEALKDGVEFPPLDVFDTGTEKLLADGFHRYRAHKLDCHRMVLCNVRQGTRRDAILFACGANAGLRRSNADKERAVKMLLEDEEWGQRTDNWIAAACAVSQPFVSEVRRRIGHSPNNGYKVGRDGKNYKIETLGRKTAAQPQTRPTPAPQPSSETASDDAAVAGEETTGTPAPTNPVDQVGKPIRHPKVA